MPADGEVAHAAPRRGGGPLVLPPVLLTPGRAPFIFQRWQAGAGPRLGRGSVQHIARRTGGAVLPFGARSMGKLRKLLEAVATLAAGGVKLLQKRRQALSAATLLLQHLSDEATGAS